MHRGPGRAAQPCAHHTDARLGEEAIDAWTSVADVAEGHVFRPLHRGDRVSGLRMNEKVVWHLLRPHTWRLGFRE